MGDMCGALAMGAHCVETLGLMHYLRAIFVALLERVW